MITNEKGEAACVNHPRFYGIYKVRDKQNNEVLLCESCRLNQILSSVEILVCKHCDVIVKSETDATAKFTHAPHKPGCPRRVWRKPPTTIDFEEFENEFYAPDPGSPYQLD